MLLILGPHFENHCPGNSAQILAVAILSRKPQTTAWQRENTVKKTPPGTYPAKTLDTDIVCVLATRSSVYHSVSKLIIGRVPCHSAEQLAPVLHQNWRGERIQPDFRAWPRCQPANGRYIHQTHLLPLYLGTQRTLGSRPLMLKCFPSKWAHCSSRKSRFCLRHGSVLQDLNFILRPTQYFPPFFGLGKKKKSEEHTHCIIMYSSEHHSLIRDFLSSREVNLGWQMTEEWERALNPGFAFLLSIPWCV